MRTIITATALAFLSTAAFTQTAPVAPSPQSAPQTTSVRVPNPFKDYDQAKCETAASMGALWKLAEHWVRDDGKERNSRARCTFDSKSARAYIAKQLAGKQ